MDTKTLLLALALGNLSLCAGLFFFDYGNKRSLALATWTLARQCQTAAWFLLYFRGILPDVLSIPLASALLFAGVAIEGGALWELGEHHGWRRLTLPALVLTVLFFLGAYLFDVGGSLRAVSGSLIVAGFYLSGAAALGRGWRGASLLRRYLALSTAVLALVVAGRGALGLLLPEGWGWITPTLVQMLGYGALYLLMLVTGLGYLLLAREQLQQELARLAVVDSVTDVPNRRGFFNALAPWLALARRPGLPTSLIVLDFDQFKRVNDDYGHPAGDGVLRSVVEVCKRQLRETDQLGRLGGVEFAVLLPRTGLPEAALVAERMRAAIAGHAFKAERAMINLTASFGVTVLRADDSTVSLFKRADEALQEAKLGGRNQVVEAAAPAALEA